MRGFCIRFLKFDELSVSRQNVDYSVQHSLGLGLLVFLFGVRCMNFKWFRPWPIDQEFEPFFFENWDIRIPHWYIILVSIEHNITFYMYIYKEIRITKGTPLPCEWLLITFLEQTKWIFMFWLSIFGLVHMTQIHTYLFIEQLVFHWIVAGARCLFICRIGI